MVESIFGELFGDPSLTNIEIEQFGEFEEMRNGLVINTSTFMKSQTSEKSEEKNEKNKRTREQERVCCMCVCVCEREREKRCA
jgi:hypothetical protein